MDLILVFKFYGYLCLFNAKFHSPAYLSSFPEFGNKILVLLYPFYFLFQYVLHNAASHGTYLFKMIPYYFQKQVKSITLPIKWNLPPFQHQHILLSTLPAFPKLTFSDLLESAMLLLYFKSLEIYAMGCCGNRIA